MWMRGNIMDKRFQGPFRDVLMCVCLRYGGREGEGAVRYEFITYRSGGGGGGGGERKQEA
jgi:hypothetical protein